ncbi:MAG: RsmD family RNA methyltransferase, partial [Rhodospirillaceae bacterium]
IDPPYGETLGSAAMKSLAAQHWLADGAIVSVESDSKATAPQAEEFTLLDRRTYGRAAIAVFQFRR